MGVVHLAETRGPGGFEKLVVVKELKHELSDDPVYCAMFLDEARLAARLSHRHIVQTNEVGCDDGRYFMALELLEGGSLQQIRTKVGLRGLPLPIGLRVLSAVLSALHHAHELADDEGRSLGVVHRDVSPQNVFLTFDGDVKLIDFGVAKSKDRRGAAAVTQVGVVKGSVPYMSPDHVDGRTIDRRADVFAVGVLLREMLLGERLWGADDDLAILRSLIRRKLPAFPADADVPAPLRAIAEKAMAPERVARFASAAAMAEALDAYLEETDPRGSLEDVGAWLATALAPEREAFRQLVRRSRAQAAVTATGKATALPPSPPVWLPSCDLRTRHSRPISLPAAPPPLPAAHGLRAAKRRASRIAITAACAALAGLLALTGVRALGGDGLGSLLAHPGAGVAANVGDRAPRSVEGAVTVSTDTSAAAEAPSSAESAAISAAIAEPERPSEEPSASVPVPAEVLHEALPPNPYGGAQ